MKFSYIFVIFAVLVVFGCNKPSTEVKVDTVVGVNGYKFDGQDSKQQACTTGVQNFDSLYRMCMSLQDSIQNNDCAQKERIDKFTRDCEPKGFSFFESHKCIISIIDSKAEVSLIGEYDKQYLLKSQSFCTGRSVKSASLAGLRSEGYFFDKIAARVEMEFVPEQQKSSDNFSYFKLSMFEDQGDEQRISFEEINYNDGALIRSGAAPSGQYKYLITCGNVAVCD